MGPRSAATLGVCPRMSARPRRSPPLIAKSPAVSTIRCVTVWNTEIREPPIARRVTANASSPISREGQSRSDIPDSPRQRPAECFLGIARNDQIYWGGAIELTKPVRGFTRKLLRNSGLTPIFLLDQWVYLDGVKTRKRNQRIGKATQHGCSISHGELKLSR